MPQIIPIRDLKNTSVVSSLCHNTQEPVFITKNGYGDMVIMSIDTYERSLFLANAERKILEAEKELEEGKGMDAKLALKNLKERYGL